MLNIIYHKSFATSGHKECVDDDTYLKMLDYIEWFDSPALIDKRSPSSTDDLKIIDDEEMEDEDKDQNENEEDQQDQEDSDDQDKSPKKGRKKGSCNKPKTIDMEVELT